MVKETFPFKWGATALVRLFEEMCSAQTRAAASPVFLTAQTWLTPDGWSNSSHLSLNPHGGSSLYSFHCRNVQAMLLGHPSSRYLLKAHHPTACTVFVKADIFVGFAAFALWQQPVTALFMRPPTLFQVHYGFSFSLYIIIWGAKSPQGLNKPRSLRREQRGFVEELWVLFTLRSELFLLLGLKFLLYVP